MLKSINNAKDSLTARVKNRSSGDADKYVVALDIGTENVKALIGKIHGENVDIVGVGKAHQGLSDMQAGAVADIAAVTANCNKALSAAEQQAGVSPRAVVVGIAGELVKGTTVSVRIKRKDAKKPLDIDEIDKIISIVQKRAFEQARSQIAEELGGKDVDVQLVNSALVRMEIDGYAVTNPVSFQGREITVQLYAAFAPLIHIGAIEQVVGQLDMDLLAVAAEPFAVARSIMGNDSGDSTMSAILMDVGGGTTDIAVVDEGGVQGTKMFGIGGRAFTRSIERDAGISFDQAESAKLSIVEQPTTKEDELVHKALLKTTKVWRSGVELALEEFTSLDHLPHNILLCGGGASLQLLIDELEESSWYRSLPFAKKPTIKYISPSTVAGITDTTDKLNDHTFITAMGLLRVGLDTIEQTTDETSDAETSVRARINRLLRI